MEEKAYIMGVPVHRVTLSSALERFKQLVNGDSCSMIFTPNTEIVMTAQQDEELMTYIREADLVIPDGIGLIYASKIKKQGLTERVTGVDLMSQILQYCDEEKKSIFIFGGKPGVAETAAKNISHKFSNISIKGVRNGYFTEDEEDEIVKMINEEKPDVLFVALGAPKQEKWIATHKDQLRTKVAMGVGGSVDIWAGTIKRAPEIYQRLGLEWFYRLLKEPWRYKRMLVLPKFLLQVIFKEDTPS